VRTLIHLSDLHFARLDPVVVAPLCAAIESASPDLIAISGDFTQRATQSEFAAARAFLDKLHAPKLLVPGNPDVPLWNLGTRTFMPLTRYKRYISPPVGTHLWIRRSSRSA
jgi:3',5'-cyclic AMP phosphodiesterase CpdA